MRIGHEHHQNTVAIEAAGGVVEHGRRNPSFALPHLPHQWRSVGDDADAFDVGADRQLHGVAGEAVLEAEIEAVAWRHGAAWETGDRRMLDAQVVPHVDVALGCARGQRGDQLRLGDEEVVDSREHARQADVSGGRYLRPSRNGDRMWHGADQPEGEVRPCRSGGERFESDQVEHVRVERVGHLVEAEDGHLRHPGEQLDQGHTRIGHVVVGPLRAVRGDQSLGFVDEILETAVVEIGDWQAHAVPSMGMT